MPLAARPIHTDTDLPLIADLAWAAPEMTPHRVDLPWRLCSSALDDPRNARLWFASDGTPVGFAAWQVPWAALDVYVRSGPWQREVEDAFFAWAGERFRELDAARGHRLPYWVEARTDDAERLEMLARHGYTDDDDVNAVLLTRPLTDLLPAPEVPDGFTIRPLAGDAEVAAYVALHRAAFESDTMTAAWRRRTLAAPHFQPDLDLVAVAPDGALAGFCVCWLAPDHASGQIEPAGVHPRFQRLRLARALQREAFLRLRAHGASVALVEPWAGDTPAVHAYADAGFRPVHTIIRKGRMV
jgi:ribosomal protein S18 acetylase RimI-like enzyme